MNHLEAIRIYLRVAEAASFTQAAQDLGLPKSSISSAVQWLESLVGTRLLHRTTRRVQMSPDGEVFYERCKDLLSDVEDLEGMFRSSGADLKGRLRVDMSMGIARSIVLPRLPEFMQAHPQLAIEFSSTDRMVDLVREGFDCVLRVGVLSDSSLVGRRLGALKQINCASAPYLAAYGVPQSLEDLRRHHLVHYVRTLGSKDAGFEYVDLATGELRALPMTGSITVNNSDAYQAACLAGMGLIQAPEMGLRPYIESGALMEILPRHLALPLPVTLLYGNRRHVPKRLQAFMQWLEQVLRPYLVDAR
jgi:DNA-binding transcriptional LysR family regulator